MRPGDEFTNPGTPWLGKTVFCLASGDSLRRLTERQWHGIIAKQWTGSVVLAVNSSIKTARLNGCEPNALFFTDANWFEDNVDLLAAYQGRAFTVSRRAKAEMPKLERIDNTTRPDFGVGQGRLKDGRSSGHRAVSLAIMCGAARVVMLGYDMRIDPVSGRSHCHDDYKNTENAKSYAHEFIPSFAGWDAAARDVGCEVLNCTEQSALHEFSMASLDAVLSLADQNDR